MSREGRTKLTGLKFSKMLRYIEAKKPVPSTVACRPSRGSVKIKIK